MNHKPHVSAQHALTVIGVWILALVGGMTITIGLLHIPNAFVAVIGPVLLASLLAGKVDKYASGIRD